MLYSPYWVNITDEQTRGPCIIHRWARPAARSDTYDMKVDNTFSAVADPTRRAILRQLLVGPARVTELAAPHKISLNSVSKHLKTLERANLIRREVRGRDHWFTFQDEPLREAQAWMSETLSFWEKQMDSLEEFFKARRKRDGPGS